MPSLFKGLTNRSITSTKLTYFPLEHDGHLLVLLLLLFVLIKFFFCLHKPMACARFYCSRLEIMSQALVNFSPPTPKL